MCQVKLAPSQTRNLYYSKKTPFSVPKYTTSCIKAVNETQRTRSQCDYITPLVKKMQGMMMSASHGGYRKQNPTQGNITQYRPNPSEKYEPLSIFQGERAMEDALKAAFESQFGTEWSTPVVAPTQDTDAPDENNFEGGQSESEEETGSPLNSDGDSDSDDDGPITVRHNETNDTPSGDQPQPKVTKAQKRRFLNSGGAPKDDTEVHEQKPKTKDDHLDLQNDLELQRLIEESHILHERPKGQEYTGADISGAGDPMELVGNDRLKLMQARLARMGAKQTKQRAPQAIAVGMRNKAAERTTKQKQEARDAGIVLARDRHERSKNRRRDTGLRINAVGRASEHGIHISSADMNRVKKQVQASKGSKGRRRK